MHFFGSAEDMFLFLNLLIYFMLFDRTYFGKLFNNNGNLLFLQKAWLTLNISFPSINEIIILKLHFVGLRVIFYAIFMIAGEL